MSSFALKSVKKAREKAIWKIFCWDALNGGKDFLTKQPITCCYPSCLLIYNRKFANSRTTNQTAGPAGRPVSQCLDCEKVITSIWLSKIQPEPYSTSITYFSLFSLPHRILSSQQTHFCLWSGKSDDLFELQFFSSPLKLSL